MLRDSVVVVVVVRTRPRAITLPMITMRKSTHGFPSLSCTCLSMGLRLEALRAAGAPLKIWKHLDRRFQIYPTAIHFTPLQCCPSMSLFDFPVFCLSSSIVLSRYFEIFVRMRFFKKIRDWILKSERIRKRILRFFTNQINPRSLGSWCIQGTEVSTLEIDSAVPLTPHDPSDLGLINLMKKHKIRFRILSDLRIKTWIFLKKRTLNSMTIWNYLKLRDLAPLRKC